MTKRRKRVRFCAQVMQIQPFAILLALYFYILILIPNFCSLFWFTQNQGQVIQSFYAFGCLVGSQNLSFLVITFIEKYRIIQAILFTLFTIAVVCIETTAHYGFVSIMSSLMAILGLMISILISVELFRLDHKSDHKLVPMSLACFGIYGGALCGLCDKLHYMNRDSPTWSYILMGFSAFLLLISVLLTLPWCHNGLKCCSCCCSCCKKAFGSVDESDEEDAE